jgi:hypothetical protein
MGVERGGDDGQIEQEDTVTSPTLSAGKSRWVHDREIPNINITDGVKSMCYYHIQLQTWRISCNTQAELCV